MLLKNSDIFLPVLVAKIKKKHVSNRFYINDDFPLIYYPLQIDIFNIKDFSKINQHILTKSLQI